MAARAVTCAGLLDGLPSGQEEEDLLEIEEQVKTQGARVKQSKNSTAEVCSCILLIFAQCTHSHAGMSNFLRVPLLHYSRDCKTHT